MADIQFEEEQQYQPAPGAQTEQKSFLIRLVLATGIVSTDKAAEYVLLGFAVAVISISLFLSFNTLSPEKTPHVPGIPTSSK